MTQFVDVVEVNPIQFVKTVTEQIAKGFYVQNSIAGYPVVGLPYQIRLFEDAAPTVRNKLGDEIHTAVVEGYDIMQWLLDVQDVVVQGYSMVGTGAVVDNFKFVVLSKNVEVKFDLDPNAPVAPVVPEAEEKPAPKAKRAKATKPTTQEGE